MRICVTLVEHVAVLVLVAVQVQVPVKMGMRIAQSTSMRYKVTVDCNASNQQIKIAVDKKCGHTDI